MLLQLLTFSSWRACGTCGLSEPALAYSVPLAQTKEAGSLVKKTFSGTFEWIKNDKDISLLETGVTVDSSARQRTTTHKTAQLQGQSKKCEEVIKHFDEDFKSTQKEFVGLLERLTKDELLQERHCLKGIFDDSKAALFNPSEVTVVKESVELHFGAVWLWDNIAQLISNQPDAPKITKRFWSGIPPPILVGDYVKLMEEGSTLIIPGEHTVTAVRANKFIVTNGKQEVTVTRDRLLLTIKSIYVVIADKVLRNELKGMVDNDPSLLADIEEICRHTGVLEAFQKTKKNGDPRYLLEAMKTSEAFHFMNIVDAVRLLPSIKASPIQKPGRGRYRKEPAEMSTLYTAKTAVEAFETLQLIRGHTALGGCNPLTHKHLYGTANELLIRMIENAKFEVLNMQGQDVLYSALENQCRSTAAFVFPRFVDPWSVVVSNCIKVWEKTRNDWSQLVLSTRLSADREVLASDCNPKMGRLAPGYLNACDARCMAAVLKRNFWFDKRFVKRTPIGKEEVLAGDGTDTSIDKLAGAL